MDLTALYDTYERMPPKNHVSPEIILKILLYAYQERVENTSRIIENRCRRDIHYMYLLEGRVVPDHATIARTALIQNIQKLPESQSRVLSSPVGMEHKSERSISFFVSHLKGSYD